MKLKDILAIGGKPGLYKFIAQAKNGIIVESLADGKRIPAYASEKVSALEDVAIFTDDSEASLSTVFDTIHEMEEGGKAISHKSPANELKSYFEKILPEYDRDRVYVSDMKKVISWYNQLFELDMLEKEVEESNPDDKSESQEPDAGETEKKSMEKQGEENKKNKDE